MAKITLNLLITAHENGYSAGHVHGPTPIAVLARAQRLFGVKDADTWVQTSDPTVVNELSTTRPDLHISIFLKG